MSDDDRRLADIVAAVDDAELIVRRGRAAVDADALARSVESEYFERCRQEWPPGAVRDVPGDRRLAVGARDS